MVLTTLEAVPGKTFIVVVFPATTAGFAYDKKDFSFLLQGAAPAQAPDLFTIGFGVNASNYAFNTSQDAFYAYFNIPIVVAPGTMQHLAVAFEIPEGNGKGVLTVQGINNNISW